MRRWFLLSLCLGVVACGGDDIEGTAQVILNVQSDLAVPDEVDELEVMLLDGAGDSTLYRTTLALEGFPQQVSLGVRESWSSPLRARTRARLGSLLRGMAEVGFEWRLGVINRVTIDLEAVEP